MSRIYTAKGLAILSSKVAERSSGDGQDGRRADRKAGGVAAAGMRPLFLLLATMAGCMNLATPPAQISGAYVSSLRYEGFECSRLTAESESLARRENQLVVAQEQRRESSKVQAFWTGYGHGDGIEASELANVRGEKEAVRKAMDAKKCSVG